jgi:hypothetical protein
MLRGTTAPDGTTVIARPVRVFVQKYDAAGVLTDQALQSLDSDTLARDHGALAISAPSARVRLRLPLEALDVRATLEGSREAQATVAHDPQARAGSVTLRFETP